MGGLVRDGITVSVQVVTILFPGVIKLQATFSRLWLTKIKFLKQKSLRNFILVRDERLELPTFEV